MLRPASRRRECLVPTLKGWTALLLVGAVLGFVSIREVHPFLAVNAPLPGGLLVVEGWASDYALRSAIAEFKQNHYDKVYVTGGPLEVGAPLIAYQTYAELGAASLVKLGLYPDSVQAIPAPPVRQDRTYSSAVSLKYWLQEHHVTGGKLHLFTEGPHARRSRLLFERALGSNFQVGVTAVPVQNYDPRHWWRTSSGVRSVIGEVLAYAYARVLFRPDRA